MEVGRARGVSPGISQQDIERSRRIALLYVSLAARISSDEWAVAEADRQWNEYQEKLRNLEPDDLDRFLASTAADLKACWEMLVQSYPDDLKALTGGLSRRDLVP